jgi:hypothetical protein
MNLDMQVKLDGKEIPDSNIADLVSDAMRSRRNFNPTGSKEFFRILSKLNVQGESKKPDTFDIQMNNKGVSFF